jgi:hypothetical protein
MKHVRKRLTYANVMSSLAVFLVLGGATAFAASKIGAKQLKANSVKTGKIAKEAVTTSKLRNGSVVTSKIGAGAVTGGQLGSNSVTGSKIANGSITSDKLATQFLPTATAGVPLAGVNVAANGTLRRWFNRMGGEPRVEQTGPGSYIVVFPGLEGQAFFSNSLAQVSLDGGAAGLITRTSSGGDPVIHTFTFDSTGAVPTDREFDYVLILAGSG